MELYHASKTSGISMLNPRPHNALNGEKVVFATSDLRFALSMAHTTGDDIAACYAINPKSGKKEFYVDELEPGELKKLNDSASIYKLDPKYFQEDSRLMKEEFISYSNVPVKKEERVGNVLIKLRDLGANIIPYKDVPKSMEERGKDPENSFIEYESSRFKKPSH